MKNPYQLAAILLTMFCLSAPTRAQSLTGSGNALTFNGANTRILCGSGNRTISNQVTVEAWVKTTSAAYQWVAAKYSNGNFEDGGFFLYLIGGQAGFDGRCGVGQYFSSGQSLATYNDGRWHHLAGVFAFNAWFIYVDGLLVSTRSYAINVANLAVSEPLAIGYYPAQNSQYFDGDIDELRLWRTARTEAEIQDNMCRKITATPALVAHYRFDQSAGPLLTDQGSQPTDGILSGFGASPWHLSGAALGDVSTRLYRPGSLVSNSLTLPSASGDSAIASTTSPIPGAYGVQLYTVNSPPSLPAGAGAAPNYFGVFMCGTSVGQPSLPFRLRLRPTAGPGCRTASQRGSNNQGWAPLPLTATATSLLSGALANRGEYILAGPAVAPAPVAISGDSVVCAGSTGQLTAAATGASAYRWNTGATTASIAVTQGGTYAVTATFAAGCTQQANYRVRLAPVLAPFSLGADATLCAGERLTISGPRSPAGLRYLWSDGSVGPQLVVSGAGNYSLRVANECGSQRATRTVSVRSCLVPPLVVPNVITPGNDHFNDLFAVTGLQGEGWELSVFNRWGRAVVQTNNYHNDWGGDAPAGLYYVLLRRANYQYKGWLEIIR